MSTIIPVPTSHMTFDEEFNAFSSSSDGSTGTWMTAYPYGGEAAHTLAGNNEAEYYSNTSVGENPFSLQNGALSITATPAAAGSNPYGLPYDSGVITTDTSFSQTYGYFEARVEMPAGQGLWPAFWMLPASNVYTSELDVFEALGNNTSTIYSTVHGNTQGQWGAVSQALSVPDISAGFHTYGVDWEKLTTTFYVDGVQVASTATPDSMNSPMFMLLNLAVGGAGSWPGAPDATTTFPASMQIDYVHAYATAGTTFVGGRAALAAPVTVGTGPDTLALTVSEDAWQGDAQYTVAVDGVQIGGVQIATASHASGNSTVLDVAGTFGIGAHQVSVNFLNDAYGGTASTDRNLYVSAATINGTAVPGSLTLMAGGTQSMAFAIVPPPVPPAYATLGSGPDTLALTVAEDAWKGDAQFTVSVDGVQIGGVQTATAAHVAGGGQVFAVKGAFSGGPHQVSVNFLNDAYGGSANTDRNLFVTGATIDGAAINGSGGAAVNLALMSSGAQGFAFTGPAGAPAPTTAGADSLVVGISEDAWNGDAQFTVSVDGKQAGGVYTTTASHGAGAHQAVQIAGAWGAGPHTVGITFINDAYGGTASTDRNLYVDSVSYDGRAASGATATLWSNGTANVTVAASPSLQVMLSEDAYQGDAQYAISLDGTRIGAPQTVTADHGAGASQAVAVLGALQAGWHDLSVSFLNDAYGGSATTDRNLYVDAIKLNGTDVAGGSATLYSAGTQHFSVYVPPS